MYIEIVVYLHFAKHTTPLYHWTSQIPWQCLGREICTTTLYFITKYWGGQKILCPPCPKVRGDSPLKHGPCICAYGILYCMPRNISVRLHLVTCFVRTLMHWIETICMLFIKRCASSSNFFIRSFQSPDALCKSIFCRYSTLLHNDDRTQ